MNKKELINLLEAVELGRESGHVAAFKIQRAIKKELKWFVYCSLVLSALTIMLLLVVITLI